MAILQVNYYIYTDYKQREPEHSQYDWQIDKNRTESFLMEIREGAGKEMWGRLTLKTL